MADVTDATFTADVVERSATVPVVVDLWAPWCGPCKTLTPILERVIGETQGRVELAKVNVDENPQVSQAFQVQSIPAVYAMYDGKVVDGFMGAQPESEVVEFVQRVLDMAAPAGDVGTDDESETQADVEEAEEPAEPRPEPPADIEDQLETLLLEVKTDDDAREKYLELLELFDPEDPRANTYRRRLATALF
jgi:putative thioredoxin